VSLPGHVADVGTWLSRADALVLSSRYEGVPAVVLEALAQGVPVIATDCCVSMRALLGNGAFGLLTRVGDAGALANAIRDFDRRSYDVGAMRVSARAFTVDHAAPRYVALMAALRASAHRTEAVVEA
jgi:glycosyltransferase involved in cell wall biosynthesis